MLSLIIGICVFLGNISGQAKSYKIVGHLSAHHSTDVKAHHHHHHHHQHAKSKKNNKTQHHKHSTELSLATVHLALSSFRPIYISAFRITSSVRYLSLDTLNQHSFSSSIFRPPIT